MGNISGKPVTPLYVKSSMDLFSKMILRFC